MYFFGLCFYTALKIKYNMPDEKFSQRIEKVMHISIIFLSLGFPLFGLVTRTINSSVIGSMCLFAAYPTGCRLIPRIVGECDEIIEMHIPFVKKFYSFSVPVFCLLGIVCCMGTVCWEIIVRKKESNLCRAICPRSKRAAGISNSREEDSVGAELRASGSDVIVTTDQQPSPKNMNHKEDKDLAVVEHPGTRDANINMMQAFVLEREIPIQAIKTTDEGASPPPEPTESQVMRDQDLSTSRNSEQYYSHSPRRSDHFTQQYHREIAFQAFSFLFAFLLTFTMYWYISILLMGRNNPSALEMRVVHVLYPLGGFFNVLAYSRPKIRALRIRNTGYSWFRAFFHVMRTGGDVQQVPIMTFERGAVGNRLHDASVPVQESTAFGALNAPPETTNLSLSNVALDNCSASFSTDNAGYRNESSWKYVISATNDDENESFNDGRITTIVKM